MIRAKLIGPTGYTGGEIFRLLLFHPEVEIVQTVARVEKPTPITDFLPNLRAVTDVKVEPVDSPDPDNLDLVFLAVPNGTSQSLAPKYLEKGIRVIDLSGDYRIHKDEYPVWYGFEHESPQWLAKAVYGMTELNRSKVKKAQLLSNPGCYATAVALGCAPLMKTKIASTDRIICDCKSGVSGAGRKPKPNLHFPQVADGFSAYKLVGHQHTPEIERALKDLTDKEVKIRFTPHLLPIRRGILVTLYFDMLQDTPLEEIISLYQTVYKNEPFVRVIAKEPNPQLSSVVGSNFCDISLYLDERTGTLMVVSMIDNLLKGAAGLAVQNMNVMFGFPETTALERPGMYP